VDQYVGFLEKVNADFYEDVKGYLRKEDLEKLLNVFSPIIAKERIKKLKELMENNDASFTSELKNSIEINWGEKVEHLPENVFKKIPDVVFENYMDATFDENDENKGFLDIKNDVKIDEKNKDAFEIYRTLRKQPKMGNREIRLFPFLYKETKEIAKKLKENTHSLIAVVSNPVDFQVELLYRLLGTDFKNRIFGVNYVDSSRHTALRYEMYDEYLKKKEQNEKMLDFLEKLVNIQAYEIGPHNRNAVLLSDFDMRQITMSEARKIVSAEENNLRKENKRLWQKTAAWPAMHGKESYKEVCPAFIRLLYKLWIDKESLPNSIRIKLSEYRDFDGLLKGEEETEFPIGYFSGIFVNEEKNRIEMKIRDKKGIEMTLDEKKKIAEAFLTGPRAFAALEENVSDFPKDPKMPFTFDLGYICCKNSAKAISWYNVDSSMIKKRKPKQKLELDEPVQGFVVNGHVIVFRNVRTHKGRESAFYVKNKKGSWKKIGSLESSEVQNLSKVGNQVFVHYNSNHEPSVARIDLDADKFKIEKIENLKYVLADTDEYLIAKNSEGIIKLDKQTLGPGTSFESSSETVVKAKTIESILSASNEKGKIKLWDFATGKKLETEHKSKGGTFEILKDNEGVYLYTINDSNEIEVRQYAKSQDLLDKKKSDCNHRYNIDGKFIMDFRTRKDKDSGMDFLVVTTLDKQTNEKEITVLTKRLEYAGKVKLEDNADLSEHMYFTDEVNQ
ncbi:hypothetical protein KY312_02235, partial [Candidatus Woesearchaeota archaeon]|nr:hypothetical protein [Candidatus Woesearchaeota archaeon]